MLSLGELSGQMFILEIMIGICGCKKGKDTINLCVTEGGQALKIQLAEPKSSGCSNSVGSHGCEQKEYSQDPMEVSSSYTRVMSGLAFMFAYLSVVVF